MCRMQRGRHLQIIGKRRNLAVKNHFLARQPLLIHIFADLAHPLGLPGIHSDIFQDLIIIHIKTDGIYRVYGI